MLPAAPAGYAIDWATVTDLAPELTLGGDGLGSARLDTAQAPVVLEHGDAHGALLGQRRVRASPAT